LLQPTPEAIHAFNKSNAKKIGLFHVTCWNGAHRRALPNFDGDRRPMATARFWPVGGTSRPLESNGETRYEHCPETCRRYRRGP
jgi:hypothetical protein